MYLYVGSSCNCSISRRGKKRQHGHFPNIFPPRDGFLITFRVKNRRRWIPLLLSQAKKGGKRFNPIRLAVVRRGGRAVVFRQMKHEMPMPLLLFPLRDLSSGCCFDERGTAREGSQQKSHPLSKGIFKSLSLCLSR